MDRQQTIERLQVWARRAHHEAEFADTAADRLHWQGQAQVLSGVATYLQGRDDTMDAMSIWRQIVSDRSQAIAAWESVQDGPQAMFNAGMVAGYDMALSVVKDVMGRSWSENRLKLG